MSNTSEQRARRRKFVSEAEDVIVRPSTKQEREAVRKSVAQAKARLSAEQRQIIAEAFKAYGSIGGKAGRGKAKKRSAAHYKRMAQLSVEARKLKQVGAKDAAR